MEANIIPHGVRAGDELSAILKFFENFGALARLDRVQAVVLGAMLFTLIIWVFAMLQLFIAGSLYVIYLCHVIGADNGLEGYCKVRVDEKLGQIVESNHKKELARQKNTETPKSGKSNGKTPPAPTPLVRQPTVPNVLGDRPVLEKPPIPRVPTASHGTDGNGNRLPTLPNLAALEKLAPAAVTPPPSVRTNPQTRPQGPNRTNTSATNDSRLDLLVEAAAMGYGGRGLERNASGTEGSIYTQRSVYDGYGNSDSPTAALSMGRPTPTPSRQQMRPPPPAAHQSYRGDVGPMRNHPGMYQQQQQQQQVHNQEVQQSNDSFGNYNDYHYDNSREYHNNTYNNGHWDGYDKGAYEEPDRNYPMYNSNNNHNMHGRQQAPQQQREYAHPSHYQRRPNMQQQYGQPQSRGYPTPSTTPAPPQQSGYPPLSRAFTGNRGSDTSSISSGPSITSRSGYSGRQLYLNGFDFKLGQRDEIEMTPQAPIVNATNSGQHHHRNGSGLSGEDEDTHSQIRGDTSTFGGGMSSRASLETLDQEDRDRGAHSVADSTTSTSNHTRKHKGYNAGTNLTPPSSRSLTSNNQNTPPSPPRLPRTAAPRTQQLATTPGDYFGTANNPLRAGTAPPTTTTASTLRSPPGPGRNLTSQGPNQRANLISPPPPRESELGDYERRFEPDSIQRSFTSLESGNDSGRAVVRVVRRAETAPVDGGGMAWQGQRQQRQPGNRRE